MSRIASSIKATTHNPRLTFFMAWDGTPDVEQSLIQALPAPPTFKRQGGTHVNLYWKQTKNLPEKLGQKPRT
jgi:hypothetical protein